jgi:hypothetical protein
MGHINRECLVSIFRVYWPGRWAGEYKDIRSRRIPAPTFAGIPAGKYNLCRDRCSPFGLCPASLPCATYFDTGSQAAKDATAVQDKLIDIFNRIELFFHRLEIYTSITPTTAMTNVIVQIMVEVLTILAIATEAKLGRLSELISCISTFLPDRLFREVFEEADGKQRHRG